MKPPGISWVKYFAYGVGRRLSLMGERLGIELLTYNPLVMLKFHQESSRDAPKIAAPILRAFPQAKQFLDVGSGSGSLAAELKRLGVNAVSCERSFVGRKMAAMQGVDCRPFDLRHNPPTNIKDIFDVVSCFEVAEHLSPELAGQLVNFICSHARNVVFTAAHPGQGGTGHVNEQPKEYWIEQFIEQGFLHDLQLSEQLCNDFRSSGASSWYAENISVFSGRNPDNIS